MLLCVLLIFALASGIFADSDGRPVFPNTFSTDVTGMFLGAKQTVSASLYFDGDNNRAAIDILYQGEQKKKIYNFKDDQLLTLQDTDCTTERISKDNSFFPYTEKDSKKQIASAEEVFYFTNSVLDNKYTEGSVHFQIYCRTVDIPYYNRKNCKILHRFTDASVTPEDCDLFNCSSTLVGIDVKCETGTEEIVDNNYEFFRFHNTVDAKKFEVPPGIYCGGKGGKDFPEMPSDIAFSYDLTEEWIDENVAKDVQVWYKELFYDRNYKLLRLNNYDSDKYQLSSVQIYDFYHDVGFAITPTVGQCDVGPIPEDLTMATATLLPLNLFLDQSSNRKESLAYVGLRKQHGISYYVWTSQFKKDVFKVVRELYFKKNFDVADTMSISHIEEFYYDTDEKRGSELEKVTFSPIRKLRSWPGDYAVFNVSECYDEAHMKKFQLSVDVQCEEGPVRSICPKEKSFDIGTTVHDVLVGTLYTKLSTISGLSMLRISSLQAVEVSQKGCIFEGIFLESPAILADNIKTDKHLSITDAWRNINDDIYGGGFSYFIFRDGQDYRVIGTSLKEITVNKTTKITEIEPATRYGSGSMAALGVSMTLIGAIFGAIGLFVYLRVKNRTASAAAET